MLIGCDWLRIAELEKKMFRIQKDRLWKIDVYRLMYILFINSKYLSHNDFSLMGKISYTQINPIKSYISPNDVFGTKIK